MKHRYSSILERGSASWTSPKIVILYMTAFSLARWDLTVNRVVTLRNQEQNFF